MTEAAGAHMARVLAGTEAAEYAALWFVRAKHGFASRVDSARPSDATFKHEARTVLLFDEQVSELLADRTLDLEDTDEWPRLTLL